ncbi:MAG: dihydroneopterin aldolase [Chlamydiota bacterium]
MKLSEKTTKDSILLGTIGFSKLKISCIIGVEEFERCVTQHIYVDLKIVYNISLCVTDNFKNAIDYIQLANACEQIARQGKYQLIESYAYEVLEHLHNIYPIKSSKIRVEKPSAIPAANCSFVELEKIS